MPAGSDKRTHHTHHHHTGGGHKKSGGHEGQPHHSHRDPGGGGGHGGHSEKEKEKGHGGHGGPEKEKPGNKSTIGGKDKNAKDQKGAGKSIIGKDKNKSVVGQKDKDKNNEMDKDNKDKDKDKNPGAIDVRTMSRRGQSQAGGRRKTRHEKIVTDHGLDYIKVQEYLFFSRRMIPSDVSGDLMFKSQYNIFNARGEMIFFTKEDSGFYNPKATTRHNFDMALMNSQGGIIIHFVKPYNPNVCAKNMSLSVYAPPSHLAGRIKHKRGSTFEVSNGTGSKMFKIKQSTRSDYYIMGKGGRQTGLISKHFASFGKDVVTHSDTHFGIKFPVDLDVRMKAALLGACLCIDYTYLDKREIGKKKK